MSLPDGKCGAPVQLCAIRIAELDITGAPSGLMYVSGSQIKLAAKAEISAGDEFEQKNGCGSLCVSFKDCDRLKRYNMELEVCTWDPELKALLVNGTLLTSGGDTLGIADPLPDAGCPYGVSVEGWAKNIVLDAQDGDYPYIRFVYPRTFWQVGDRELSNAISANVFNGYTAINPGFGTGPADDIDSMWDTTGPISFLDTDIPDAVCGTQAIAS